MKRKILSIILVIMILFGTMFALAGCGEEESSSRKSSSSKKSKQQSSEYYDEEDNDSTESGISGKFKKSGKASSKYAEVDYLDISKDGKTMVVTLRGKDDVTSYPYITDFSGKIIKKLNITSMSGAYLKFNGNYLYSLDSVYDRDGNKIYELKGKLVNVSDSGYVLETVEEDTMATGKVTKYNIVDTKTGENVESSDVEIIYTGFEDYFYKGVLGNNEYVDVISHYELIDVKNNENYGNYSNVSNPTIYEKYGKALRGYKFPYQEDSGGEIKSAILSLKDGYMYTYDYEGSQRLSYISNLDGEKLHDISEGGVELIKYKDGKFYIITETDYCYVLDKNFDYVVEPKKWYVDLDWIGTDHGLEITNNGIFSVDKDSRKNEMTIKVFDNNFNGIKTYTVSPRGKTVKSSDEPYDPIKVSNYGLIANQTDGKVSIYINDKEYTFDNSEITLVSDKIAKVCKGNGTNDGQGNPQYYSDPTYINLETQEEIVFHD